MKETVTAKHSSIHYKFRNISLIRLFSFLVIIIINIPLGLVLLINGWHGDKTGLDSDLKIKFHIWSLSLIVLLNFLTKFLEKEEILLSSFALLICTLPETSYVVYYNINNGYSSVSIVWIFFLISTIISFLFALPKLTDKPIHMPLIPISGTISNFIGFILVASYAWNQNNSLSVTGSLYSSFFGLAILSFVNLLTQIAVTLCETKIMIINGTLVLSFVILFTLKNIAVSKLITAGCFFILLGAVSFIFKLGFRVYKKLTKVFGKPTVDSSGNYIPPPSLFSTKPSYKWLAIIDFGCLIISVVGLILYFVSEHDGFPSIYIPVFTLSVLITTLTFLLDAPIELCVFSACFGVYLIPEIISIAFASSTVGIKVASILLSISLIVSFIPLHKKLRKINIIYVAISILFLVYILISIVILMMADKDCFVKYWYGTTPFSCTLWHSGYIKDHFLVVAFPIFLTGALSIFSVMFKQIEFTYTCIFILTQLSLNQIQPILQQNGRFRLDIVFSLVLIISSIISIVSTVVLINCSSKKRENPKKEVLPLLQQK